ncbi:MAG TPA: TonB-dependent receptor [Tepidisphaeraceae bacterium]|nr:TonB-dependent receptor [Tepidisphaeraceae bacterium]
MTVTKSANRSRTQHRIIARFLAVAVLVGLGHRSPAFAQSDADMPDATQSPDDLTSMSIEELMELPVVVAAGKRAQSQREAAASVSVVTADEINLMGYRNLAEVLRNQRSFYLHTDGLNWFAGVRGLLRPAEWNARLLVLVDGRPTRENIYGQTHLDQDFLLPIEAYKRVEIVRGPGSALYGSNAVFSVVNIVTKDGADLNGGLIRVQGGTENTARVSALYGLKTDGGWDISGGIAGYTSDGDEDVHFDGISDPLLNFGHVEGWDDERSVTGYLKIKRGEFTAMVDHADRERDSRSATYATSFFEPGTMDESRTNVTLRVDHEIAPGRSIHGMAYYGRSQYRQTLGFTLDPAVSPAIDYNYLTKAHNDWLGLESHYDWQINPKFHLLAGGEVTHSLETSQQDRDDAGFSIDIDKPFSSVALFAEGNWHLTERVTLVAGARVDHVRHVGTMFSPRAAAIVSATKNDTIKLMYGRAFRSPNLYEMFYSSADAYLANPDLDPELVDTYELAWERQLKSGWRTSLGGFFWHMSDAMDSVIFPDGTSQVQNVRDVSARGVEAELQRQWQSGGSFRAHASLTNATDDDGDRLAVSPRYIVGTAIIVPLIGKKTFLSVDAQLVGPMESDLGESTDPSYVTNVVLTSRDFLGTRGLELQAGVYNLFADDARLPHGDSFQHTQPTLNWPGTRAMVGLTYAF